MFPSSSAPQGVRASILCRDVAWLTEELLFRNRDVGFGGSLVEVVHYSLFLLTPHLIIAAAPSRLVYYQRNKKRDDKHKRKTPIYSVVESSVSVRSDPLIVPRPSSAATLHLSLQAQMVTHTFILEAVGGERLLVHVFCVVNRILYYMSLNNILRSKCSPGSLFSVGGPGSHSECWHVSVE